MHFIDLNADLGEHPQTRLDEYIMPYISSCNIACGGHIGDEQTVRKTIRLAKKYQVAVGAHPSYPDTENFGRKVVSIEPEKLKKSVIDQINLVLRIAREEGVELHHIKPHGALYNKAASSEETSMLLLEAFLEVAPQTYWMGLAHSASQIIARKNEYPFIAEGFADRRYEPNRTLMSRTKEGAVLQGVEILDQVEQMILHQQVYSKSWLTIEAQSICLHGDTNGAIELARQIRNHIEKLGVEVRAV